MAKRRVAAWKHFSGEAELQNVRWFGVAADRNPSGYATLSGPNAQFGTISLRPDAYSYGPGSHHFGNRAAGGTTDANSLATFSHSDSRRRLDH